jgi:hypothetical protein
MADLGCLCKSVAYNPPLLPRFTERGIIWDADRFGAARDIDRVVLTDHE